MHPRRFVLLDRDGTLIVEKHYLAEPEQVELIAGAAEGLRRLAARGLGLAVLTNQSGIGRGFFDAARLAEIHERLVSRLREEGVALDGVFVCPHHPDQGCDCRKPRTGLALRAAAELGFEPSRAFVVGDQASDIGLGRALGAATLLVRTGHGAETLARGEARPDHVVADLKEAAERIESLLREPAAARR
ncbi:MAG TPA: HAD family hydrolase [Myxococcota bacterium]|jgi:D-glycero-D-manno-heptose 1,7-bisphosphate phosphatase